MGDLIRLRDWIIQRLESGKVLAPPEVDKLYKAYHRMRMWEAECREEKEGGRKCPQRT